MALFTNIIINGVETAGYNVGATVGNGAKNRKDNGDVLLVQIMLYLMVHHLESTPQPQNIGLASIDQVPEPTNEFDPKTRDAILSYQGRYHRALLAVDGVVHPASYRLAPSWRYRNIRFGNGERIMMITHLHWMLLNAVGLSKGAPDYTYHPAFGKLRPLLERYA
jgi:hypothetical protein